MKKRLLGIFLVIMALLTSICMPFSALAEEGSVTPVTISDAPIQACQPSNCAVDEVNGKDYFYTTSSGTPAVFSVYNIDDKKLVARYELPGAGVCWKHIVDSKHNVYIIGHATLFRYDPFNDTLTNLGKIWPDEDLSYTMDIDENDNLYIGTCFGKVIKYDSVNNEFSNLGEVEGRSSFVKSLAYHKGYIYVGVVGPNGTKFYKINASNPSDKMYYPIPASNNPEYYQADKILQLYAMSVAGDYILIYALESAQVPMIVFDTVNNTFLTDIGFTGNFKGMYTSPVLDNKAYFTAMGEVEYFDITTGRVVDCGWAWLRKPFMGGGWVTLENNPDYPNKTLVTVDWDKGTSGNLNFWNMETHKTMSWTCGLPGGKIPIQSLENGPSGELYASGYMGQIGVRYNTTTKDINAFPMNQAEGMVEYNGKQYFGVYSGAYLYEYDPLLPVSSTNPKSLGQIGDYQDRPFAMVAADNKIFMGTIPTYGCLGGALAIYDLETKQMKTIRNIVQDQSVMSIAYKDGFIYGTTTIHGGLGSIPVDQSAKIFVYDVEKGEKVKEFVPNIKENFKPYNLGSITFDKNGKLWVATGTTIFSVDPKTEAVSNVLSFGEFNYRLDMHVWRPTYIRFDDFGLMYVNLNGMKVINPLNMKYVDLTEVGYTQLYTIGSDNNLYYTDDTKLIMLSHEQILSEYFDDLFVPEVIVSSPKDGATYLLNQDVLADWNVSDAGAIKVSETGTAAKGTAIDTSSVGTKSFTVEVVYDNGFRISKTISYGVVYPSAGFLPLVGKNNAKAYTAGSAIPVKFQLCNAENSFVTNAVARLYYAKLENGLPGQENEAISLGSANNGNDFRFDTTDNQYIFNLSTKGWSAGTYQLKILLDDGTSKSVIIDVR